MSFNDLIADYIIRKGIELTTTFNYEIDIDDLKDNFEGELIKYINDNTNDIFESIKKDERVADIYLNDKSFDMVFYWSYCLDENEKEVYEIANSKNVNLEYEEVVELGTKLWNYDKDERVKYVLELLNERDDEFER